MERKFLVHRAWIHWSRWSMTSFLLELYILTQMTRSATDGDGFCWLWWLACTTCIFESAAMIVTLLLLVTPWSSFRRVGQWMRWRAWWNRTQDCGYRAWWWRDPVQIAEVTRDVFAVRPGDSCGWRIIEGGTAIDESALTGRKCSR